MKNSKEFFDRVTHFYSQTDGTIKWPNSREGDLLKIAFEALRPVESDEEEADKSVTAMVCIIDLDDAQKDLMRVEFLMFASRVRQAQREEDAKVCDHFAFRADADCASPEWGCQEAAKAIRSGGKVEHEAN